MFGKGEAVYAQGSWDWAVKDAKASGSGWSMEGRVRPKSARQIHVDGVLEVDASTPWKPGRPTSPTT